MVLMVGSTLINNAQWLVVARIVDEGCAELLVMMKKIHPVGLVATMMKMTMTTMIIV